MTTKKCAVAGCKSASTSPDDRGVTFHKFPMNKIVRSVWIKQTQWKEEIPITKSTFVCSRHFLGPDFSQSKLNKYLLKKGSVPTIFSWGKTPHPPIEIIKEPKKSTEIESDIKEITVKTESKKRTISGEKSSKEPKKKVGRKSLAETAAAAAAAKQQTIETEIVSTPIVDFIIGTKIEAQDFNGVWHAAEIKEVDQDDREVLIDFEKNKTKAVGFVNFEIFRLIYWV